MPELKDILNVPEAASYLRVHEETIRRLSRSGEIPCFKVGSEWRFHKSDLDRWSREQVPKPRNRRVLIVDDEEDIRAILKTVFEEEGWEVVTAGDGKEALAVLDTFVPGAVILDLLLQGMDGAETLGEIRKRLPNLPIVVLTAYADTELMTKALKWSPFTVVRKPVKPEELLAVVRWVTASGPRGEEH
jgi:excisionase family DNA binding protein